MRPIDVIELKRKHIARLAAERGADGEAHAVASRNDWIPRPKGNKLKALLAALEDSGISIKGSSFDAISHPCAAELDFTHPDRLKPFIDEMVFIEIKTASQKRVKEDFSGFFFALTEKEIEAAEVLGPRHKVALFNKKTGLILMSSVSEIFARTRSSNWQVSVQI